MCAFSQQDITAPTIATEMAAAKSPDANAAAGAGNMARNRVRSAASTILTSGSGVTAPASTAKKTLLGA